MSEDAAGAGLGNIFDAVEGEASGPRGRDLIHTVELPQSALGSPGGQLVPIPEKIVYAGERVRRLTDLDPEPGWVHLHLAEDFPEGAALKLRGQGEPKQGGQAGDLILKVRFNPEAPVRLPPGPALVATAPGASGVPALAENSNAIFWGILLVTLAGVGIALAIG
jgi:hypothetical protein